MMLDVRFHGTELKSIFIPIVFTNHFSIHIIKTDIMSRFYYCQCLLSSSMCVFYDMHIVKTLSQEWNCGRGYKDVSKSKDIIPSYSIL